jgi:predicted TIM-barrel enzyme
VSLAKKVDELHVGSAIRTNQSWDEPIDVKKINQIADLLKKNVA